MVSRRFGSAQRWPCLLVLAEAGYWPGDSEVSAEGGTFRDSRAKGTRESSFDGLGMLEAPGFVVGEPGGLVEVDALAADGPFCLLGEPGAGKTTALEAIAGHLLGMDDAGQGSVVFVPMAEVTDAGVFRGRVIVPVTAGISACGRVTLVLDGLEECPVPERARRWPACSGSCCRRLTPQMVERFAVGGPFRAILAVAHTSGTSLGTPSPRG